jgi:hypothetical protein
VRTRPEKKHFLAAVTIRTPDGQGPSRIISEMGDVKKVAALEGAAWALRMRDQVARRGAAMGPEWPGRLEDARALAEIWTDNPVMRGFLADTIQNHARLAWSALTREYE